MAWRFKGGFTISFVEFSSSSLFENEGGNGRDTYSFTSFIVRMYWTGLENINLATWQEKEVFFFKKGVISI